KKKPQTRPLIPSKKPPFSIKAGANIESFFTFDKKVAKNRQIIFNNLNFNCLQLHFIQKMLSTLSESMFEPFFTLIRKMPQSFAPLLQASIFAPII
ncbi:hypothetical protein, partial [Aureicoccus marinus]|uniref:hypothetical protein n=1 Tax=Aureicoccus marinus TaxID=754435 RepID=UPI001C615B87